MSSRRYQSQLFRFVAQQTQKIADKTATLGRHAKVAAIWTTQILLYPVYAVFQTTRLTGRQLRATVQKTVWKLQLTEDAIAPGDLPIDADSRDELLAVDAPILQVLTSVKQALLTGDVPKPERNPIVLIVRLFQRLKPRPTIVSEAEPGLQRSQVQPIASIHSSTPNRYRVQGVASLTDTRHLVLILEGNIISDILTPEQQRQLDRRMTWELAMYWRRQRRFRLKQAPLSLPDDRPTLLPPVRIFRQLMAWIQTSPVAIAANLFQETSLDVPPSTEIDWFNPTVPLSAFNPGNLIPREMPKSDNLGAWFAALPKWAELEALVWAAIHYFFGNERDRFASAQLPASDRLLSFTEVYGESLSTAQPLFRTKAVQLAAQPSTRRKKLASRRSLAISGQSIRQWIGGAVGRVSQAIVVFNQTRRAVLNGADPEAIEIVQGSSSIAARNAGKINTTQSTASNLSAKSSSAQLSRSATEKLTTGTNNQRSTLEHTPDWIETSVQHVEYVRSPLQKVLGWIDSGISWIERKLVALWRWITRRT